MDKSTDHDKSLFDLFLPGMNVKDTVFFFSEREFKKALRDTLMRAAWYELLQQRQIVGKFNIPLFYRYFYNHLSNYTKTIIRLRLVNIGEYSPRLRLGEYLPIFTSPSANNRSEAQPLITRFPNDATCACGRSISLSADLSLQP